MGLLCAVRSETGCTYRCESKSYGKNGNRNGSDATHISSFHNLPMPPVQHKNYLRLWRNKNIWWSDLSLLWNPKAMWLSCIRVAPHKQSDTYLNVLLCFGETGQGTLERAQKQNSPLGFTGVGHSERRHPEKSRVGDKHITDHQRQSVKQHAAFRELTVPVPPLCGSKICPITPCVLSLAVKIMTVSRLRQISHQLESVYDLSLSMQKD